MNVENRTQIPYLLLVGSTWVATWPPTGAESPLRTEYTGIISAFRSHNSIKNSYIKRCGSFAKKARNE